MKTGKKEQPVAFQIERSHNVTFGDMEVEADRPTRVFDVKNSREVYVQSMRYRQTGRAGSDAEEPKWYGRAPVKWAGGVGTALLVAWLVYIFGWN